MEDFTVIADDDKLEIVFTCNCEGCMTTLGACEKLCPRYYRCDTVALANDALKEIEGQEDDL